MRTLINSDSQLLQDRHYTQNPFPVRRRGQMSEVMCSTVTSGLLVIREQNLGCRFTIWIDLVATRQNQLAYRCHGLMSGTSITAQENLPARTLGELRSRLPIQASVSYGVP